MRRAPEITAFVALAAGLHLALAVRLPSHEGGADTGGQGGENAASVAPASEQVAALVEQWDRPPDTAAEVESPDAPPPQGDTPERPQAEADAPPPRAALAALPEARPDMAALPTVDPDTPLPPAPDTSFEVAVPDMPPPPDVAQDTPRSTPDAAPERPQREAPRPAPTDLAALPEIDTEAPPPPESELAPKASLRPPPERPQPPKPEVRRAERTPSNAEQDSAPRQAQRSAGSGGASQAGTATRSAAKTLSRGQEQSLVASWGAQVRARIESRKRHPGGRGGQVVIALTVTPAGQVAAAGIARSSGNPRLDRAALQAVRSAGRMPRAPAGLTRGSYSFSLPMAFN
ncbi:TonB family protein [Pseudooceanicola nanhaiensis]|uniref:TonB family protein n=1 Tax=Pseudooceanicola nanhaiensis TaxID=375761 RepID=UPI0040586DE1